jgi:nucleotide-binding universal stress UspA family protein
MHYVVIKHILVPFDDSVASKSAFDKALDIAKENNAKITVIAILDYVLTGEFDEGLIDGTVQLKTIRDQKIVEKQWPQLQKKASEANVELDGRYIGGIMGEGIPVGEITNFAIKNKIDLIVTGNRENGTQSLFYL